MQRDRVSVFYAFKGYGETFAKPYNAYPKKRVGFSEVTGGRALSFSNLSMGEAAAPSFSEENAEGVRNPP